MSNPKILIVDDEPEARYQLSRFLRPKGYEVDEASSGEQALDKIGQALYSVVLLDLRLPTMDGFEVLRKTLARYPDTCIIMITGYPDTEKIKKALSLGAFDFFEKPIKYNYLLPKIENAVNRFNFKLQSMYQNEESLQQYKFDKIIGKSDAMKKIFTLIAKLTQNDTTVLITGESGTGKNMVASAIHYNSVRADKALMTINCGTIEESLIASDLFGHERGAFTSADKLRRGKIERAENSTLCIDEVGELPGHLQVKLLQFLQDRTFERVGGETILTANVRIIACTNKNLADAVKNHSFREDLFYRLNVFPIHIPPLREHKDDIPLLATQFLKKFAAAKKKSIHSITDRAMDLLLDYSYPGNTRELENVIERACIVEET
ncbi:sigma-54-dependent Fis family transcriptional regulator, partial [candidate division KSB1 bacterium]|nr:sigma-54-dependent Fis family transcriptional regulator [candidate division KSB1 bacterium]